MTRPRLVWWLIVAIAFAPTCVAQSASPKATVEAFANAWSTHDMSAFDRVFAEDVRFVPTYGVMHEGRTNLVADFKKAHDNWAGTTTLTVDKTSVQQLGDDTAVVHADVSVHGPADSDHPPMGRSLMLVVVRQEDGWRIVSGQLTKPNCPPSQ